MRKFFKSVLKFQSENENGVVSQVSQEFLVDAVSYTEAEALMYKRAEEIVRGDFVIDKVVKTNITDVFDDGAPYYQMKVQYHTVDPDSGQEKTVTNNMIVSANDCKQAVDSIVESLKNMLVSFEVISVVKTKLEEIITLSINE